ncbi:MAG: serine/threonine-protein kinase [Candidatus Melainabacteria bacterium]|nr:serine/threonine-protein kinase [Candidatus Melainabacteria bacterium]
MKRPDIKLPKLNLMDEARLPESVDGTIFVPYGTRRLAHSALDSYGAMPKKQRVRNQLIALLPLVAYLAFISISAFSNHPYALAIFKMLGNNVYVIYGFVGVMLFARFIKRPTHIELGPEGMRLHWLYFIGRKSSSTIPWSAISYAHMEEKKSGYSTTENLTLTISKSDLFGQKVALIKMACLSGIKRFFDNPQEYSFSINRNHLCRESDGSKIIDMLERHLPVEKIDPTLADFCKSAQQDFTSLWLDKLSTTALSLDPLQPGTQVGNRYTVLKRIGSGGQAVTYLVEDAQCAEDDPYRQVVLKEFVLPTTGGREVTQAALQRIQHESSLIQSLEHEHIVKCLNLFCEGRRAYLVLNYIDGQSLQNVVSQGGVYSQARVIELAIMMCDLLDYLHTRTPPVVHRDFTPDNLMIQKDGSLVLIDFNVAKQMEAGDATHTVVGKHSYIPPEQFRGDSCAQSDIYAMGCTIFYLLTGEEPEPISVSRPMEKVPSVSTDLNVVVAKCTQQDLKRRYATASEIRLDLEQCKQQRAFI